ncbi:unnamed protein product [Microthlaspi erraticum]|uniref:J domain-containing protein n=1 Tax=Microthlaspi erraticum TaxID=1685480 RepID=A0A6D2L5D5_9BRAS|nr:unnamed protein product [Microthlaspi erraticum]
MECNKEEARRAMDTAVSKLSGKDYNGAKKFIDKAHKLYPKLDGLKQVSTMIHVHHISASNQSKGEEESDCDWYGILGVDPLAGVEAVKKQYKTLALLLHPDKNKFNGADGAFKLVLDAWCVLSDPSKRSAYDRKRKPKEDEEKKRYASDSTADSATDANQAKERRKHSFDDHSRESYFAAILKAERRANANSTEEAQRLFKNPMKRANLNSTEEAQRLFKKPVTASTTFNANSTEEAARLFKNPVNTAYANCTSEAARLFKNPMRCVI